MNFMFWICSILIGFTGIGLAIRTYEDLRDNSRIDAVIGATWFILGAIIGICFLIVTP